MRKVIYVLIFSIVLFSCASKELNTRITTLDYLQKGTSLKQFVGTYGPPFSIQERDDGVLLVHYSMLGKTNSAAFIPLVSWVAAGNTYAVKRYTLKFSKQGEFLNIADSNQVKGHVFHYQMVPNEGFSGKGGVSSEQDYRNVGSYLAEKGIFFDQKLWKGQNVANNYFLKFN